MTQWTNNRTRSGTIRNNHKGQRNPKNPYPFERKPKRSRKKSNRIYNILCLFWKGNTFLHSLVCLWTNWLHCYYGKSYVMLNVGALLGGMSAKEYDCPKNCQENSHIYSTFFFILFMYISVIWGMTKKDDKSQQTYFSSFSLVDRVMFNAKDYPLVPVSFLSRK